MNSINDIWQSVLQILSEKLTPTTMRTWFDDCAPLGIDGSCFVLHSPSEFKSNIIATRYGEMIKKALGDLFSQSFDLRVLGGDEILEWQTENEGKDTPPEIAGYTFDDFIVGNSNKFAHAAAVSVANNPGKSYNPLFIYGNSGLGKTHLLKAIGQFIQEHDPTKKIAYVKGDDFTVQMVNAIREGKGDEFRSKYRNVDLFLVDDIQFIAGKRATQEEFFHTFNNLYEAGRQIVITSDRPPLEMSTLEDRLRTRFEGGLICDVTLPDYETRMAIIQKKANTLGMDLPNDICDHIAQNITNNIRSLEGAVNIIKAYHELNGMPLDLPNVSRAIKDMYMDSGHNLPTPALIIGEVSRFYSVEEHLLRGRLKSNNIVMPRQIAMYLIREMTHQSYKNIGREFGRDHTTVISSLQKVEALVAKGDKETMDNLRDITANINSKL